jgi:hypothetical protein
MGTPDLFRDVFNASPVGVGDYEFEAEAWNEDLRSRATPT